MTEEPYQKNGKKTKNLTRKLEGPRYAYAKNHKVYERQGNIFLLQLLVQGLSLMLDAHTNLVAGSTVSEDFQGFIAVIDSKRQYPLTTRKTVLLKPGQENLVSLGATKITPNDNIRSTEPENRGCFYPEEKELVAHDKYSRVIERLRT